MYTDQTETQKFFASLDWPTLEKKISDALKDPHKSVPLETPCPAISSLVQEIFHVAMDSAFKSPGEDLSVKELLNADQRLCVMRILEAIIYSYEDWKYSDERHKLETNDKDTYPRSSIMKGIQDHKRQVIKYLDHDDSKNK